MACGAHDPQMATCQPVSAQFTSYLNTVIVIVMIIITIVIIIMIIIIISGLVTLYVTHIPFSHTSPCSTPRPPQHLRTHRSPPLGFHKLE